MDDKPLIKLAMTPIPLEEPKKLVKDYGNNDTGWNLETIKNYLPRKTMICIHAIVLSDSPECQDQVS